MKILFTLLTLFSTQAMASTLTLRDLTIQGPDRAEVVLDASPVKGSVITEYVRDIVQISIQNATIYPAKILHAEEGSTFSKVFAYQYAPNLVRIRFSVGGKAEALKGKIRVDQKGSRVSIVFPKLEEGANLSLDREKSLLAKVLGKTEESHDPKVEQKTVQKVTTPETNTQKTVQPLSGKSPGPSVMRSLLAMVLIVGGLGLVLIYVKRKQKTGQTQARKVGDSKMGAMFGAMFGKQNKSRPFIEVLANHSLGAKQSITVVRIKDQQFVLGVTPDQVQLITQLDSDSTDLDVLDDPKVADSIGRMFGTPKVNPETASFNALLKSSTGASAIQARSAYHANSSVSATVNQVPAPATTGVRAQIRQRLQGMKNA